MYSVSRLEQTFNCVDHNILLEKLFYYGVRGAPIKLLHFYLDNRVQCIKIAGAKSFFTWTFTIPYIQYINDIVKASNYKSVLCADDINLHISGKNEIFEKILLTTSSKVLITGFVLANLCINYCKSNFMLMNNHNNINFSVSMSQRSSLRYLGVILDDKLSWEPQIEWFVTQLSKSCGMLFKLKHYTNFSLLKSVYFALFHSYLTYAMLNWVRASKTTLLL